MRYLILLLLLAGHARADGIISGGSGGSSSSSSGGISTGAVTTAALTGNGQSANPLGVNSSSVAVYDSNRNLTVPYAVIGASATITYVQSSSVTNTGNVLIFGSLGVRTGTAAPGTKMHMSSGTLTIDGTNPTITMPNGQITASTITINGVKITGQDTDGSTTVGANGAGRPGVKTGTNVTALGNYAGGSLTSGGENTLLGSTAGYGLTSGGNNVCVGYYACRGGGDLSTGSNNLAFGNNTGFGAASGASYRTAIGAAAVSNSDNHTQIGDSNTTSLSFGGAGRAGAGFHMSSGTLTVDGNASGVVISSGNSTGQAITGHFSATASLDFGATAAGTCDLLTIAVAGASDGDTVAIGIPTALAANDVYQSFNGYISAQGVCTIKRCNLTNITTALGNPAAATVRCDAWKH